MSDRDLYEVLGVPRSAKPEEIKRAYRQLAKEHHPDRNRNDPAAEERFKEVQHAYSVLRDPKKRDQYDRFGEIGAGDFETTPSGEQVYTWGAGGQRINVEDLESLFGGLGGVPHDSPFESFFQNIGGGRRSRRPAATRGHDLRRDVNLSFAQAVAGAAIEIDVPTGTGAGQARQTIEVKIPPGVTDGQHIRLRGKGSPGGSGGPSGDLFLVCRVRSDPRFRREGRDLHVEVLVSVSEAALGGKVDVPTLSGVVTLTVPPGSSGGRKLRIRGRGVAAHGGDPAGDLYATIRIVVPAELTDEQRRLFEQLSATLTAEPAEPSGSSDD